MQVSGSQITFSDNSTQNTAATGFGFKNKLINGGFQIWQRGTSGGITGYSCADRFYFFGSGTVTVSKSSTPTSPFGNYYAQWTTGASSSYCNVGQAIESANVIPLRGQAMVVTCWVKLIAGSYAAGIQLGISYSNSSDAFSLVTGVPVQSVVSAPTPNGTWQKVKTTFTVPTDAVGLTISLNNQSVQASGVTLAIADFQCELGYTETSFDYRPYGTELQLCQRYYWRISSASGTVDLCSAMLASTVSAYGVITYPQVMRTAAAVATNAATTVRVSWSAGTSVTSNFSVDRYAATSSLVRLTTSGLTAGQGAWYIVDTGASNYIEASAEL